MKPNFELKTMENFVERVSRRKLKSLLHGKATIQLQPGSKRKPENSSNTRGHSQILSKPRSSRNFNFNNIRGRRLRGRLYNTATGEVEEDSPFILRRRGSTDEVEEVHPLFLDVPSRPFQELDEARFFALLLYIFTVILVLLLWLIPHLY